MKTARLFLLVCLAFLALSPAQARPQGADSTATRIYAPAPLVVNGVTITSFRVKLAGFTPEARVHAAQSRIRELTPPIHGPDVHLDAIPGGYSIYVGDQFLFALVQGDLDRRVVQDVSEEAQSASQALIQAVGATRHHFTAREWVLQMLLAVAGTVLAWILFRLLLAWRRRTVAFLVRKMREHRSRMMLFGFDVLTRLTGMMKRLVGLGTIFLGIILVDVWLTFLLNRFPHTRRYGHAARNFIFDNLREFTIGLLKAAPGLFTAILIMVIARYVTRLINEFFSGVEHGTIRVGEGQQETVGATKRLVVVLVWLFAIVFAYPFIPGSDSGAFKGLSVFVGLLVTFGSAGVVGHMMSGLVLVYSRALKKGDWVRVGEVEGLVTEVGALSTKIANRREEEFTIPNTVMVSSTVHNLSRLSRKNGAPLIVTITIGYDAPWRAVHRALLHAASQTEGIRREPAPMVMQSSLEDFFVEYTLVTRLENVEDRPFVLSALNAAIQDAFNERGIQIMSPHYEDQPHERIVVPPERWETGDEPESPPANP